MRLISYNLNGIRAAISKGLLDWIRESDPDILCFQELKAQPDQIPVKLFEELGYHCHWHAAEKKGYSGVGILSKRKPDQVIHGIGIDTYDCEGRLLRADYGDITIISVYHPSGTTGDERQRFKMKWLADFYEYSKNLLEERSLLIFSGDFNICHQPIDIHDPVGNKNTSGFLPEEREWLTKYLETGFIDSFRYFVKTPGHYSWWSQRFNARERNLGWRIDYHMVSMMFEQKMKNASILPDVRHSDHCPIVLDIEI